MKIKVLYFANLRETIGIDSEVVDVKTNTAMIELIKILKTNHSEMKNISYDVLYAVNAVYADKSLILKEGDEVAILPPLSGG